MQTVDEAIEAFAQATTRDRRIDLVRAIARRVASYGEVVGIACDAGQNPLVVVAELTDDNGSHYETESWQLSADGIRYRRTNPHWPDGPDKDREATPQEFLRELLRRFAEASKALAHTQGQLRAVMAGLPPSRDDRITADEATRRLMQIISGRQVNGANPAKARGDTCGIVAAYLRTCGETTLAALVARAAEVEPK